MKETTVTDPPLIGSGSQEEADARVQILLDLGKSRGYLTYDELNTRLPDEVVSPDKLDSLLMMIDEMGIKLIDELDVADFQHKGTKTRSVSVTSITTVTTVTKSSSSISQAPRPAPSGDEPAPEELNEEEEEELDLNLEQELAEASTKRIDDPVRMYLTQMGEIPLLTRE